jgi:pullulanase
VENSFESPDSINAIDWSLKTKNKEVFEYIQGLIKMRKEHPAFRMTSAKQIQGNIKFLLSQEKNVISENIQSLKDKQRGIIAYTINGEKVNDKWKKILVVLNGNETKHPFVLPGGLWKIALWNNKFDDGDTPGHFFAGPYSCSILYQE